MTQPPQEGFDRSVEDARAWMKAVQERLQVNDNTQGPRAALEARLRETEVCRGRGFHGFRGFRSPVASAMSLPPQASGFQAVKWKGCVSNFDVLASPADLGLSADSDPGGQSGPHHGIANMLRVMRCCWSWDHTFSVAVWFFCPGRGTMRPGGFPVSSCFPASLSLRSLPDLGGSSSAFRRVEKGFCPVRSDPRARVWPCSPQGRAQGLWC